ncbi:Hcp family type VI secretion system effector [Rahnella sikkimica]|uniref:Type VI secretion system protein n=1 Tax=Rahnella sikkimica TaxID=1805933 RepID=A0A2L1UUZ4_9GAMM|nr:Hcp family type VI secretion system effector [Rahnella sikkimica]AVF36684.1 type VI secretion system protein [Rahnella sikkimica]
MAHNIYLTLTGKKQGLISAGCSTFDSIGNAYQSSHRDQILVYELSHTITRDQNVVHHPVTFKKPIDKSSPLLGFGISNNEEFDAVFEKYRTDTSGAQVLFYRVKLIKATLSELSVVCPHSLDHNDAQPIETVSLNYQSITWEHVKAGTSAYSFWEERIY